MVVKDLFEPLDCTLDLINKENLRWLKDLETPLVVEDLTDQENLVDPNNKLVVKDLWDPLDYDLVILKTKTLEDFKVLSDLENTLVVEDLADLNNLVDIENKLVVKDLWDHNLVKLNKVGPEYKDQFDFKYLANYLEQTIEVFSIVLNALGSQETQEKVLTKVSFQNKDNSVNEFKPTKVSEMIYFFDNYFKSRRKEC